MSETRTSSASGVVARVAFFDELSKIAMETDVAPPSMIVSPDGQQLYGGAHLPPDMNRQQFEEYKTKRKERWKRFGKRALAGSIGYGVGHGLGMLGDKAISSLRSSSPPMEPNSKKWLLYTALGLATGGAALARQMRNERKQEALYRDE